MQLSKIWFVTRASKGLGLLLVRCGAYPNIVAAIKEVHTGKEVAQTWQFTG